MIWALEVASEDGYTSHKGMDMVSNNTQVGCDIYILLNWYLRGPNCAKKISPKQLHHHHQPEPLR